jgi:large subunit ribosomal protein L21
LYAVIESGGKQFRVELGSEIEVETMEAEPGSTVELGRVLLVADGDQAEIGRPTVEGARVSASVVRQDRGSKIVVFKYRPKARHRAKQGHRQGLTLLRVSDIVLGERSAARQEEAARGERERSRAAAEAEAARKASADQALARRLARQAEAEEAREEEPVPAGRKAGARTTTSKATPKEAARRTQAGARTAAPARPSGATRPAGSKATTAAKATTGGKATTGAKATKGGKATAKAAGTRTAGRTASAGGRTPTGRSGATTKASAKSTSKSTGSAGRTQASKPQAKRRSTRDN